MFKNPVEHDGTSSDLKLYYYMESQFVEQDMELVKVTAALKNLFVPNHDSITNDNCCDVCTKNNIITK